MTEEQFERINYRFRALISDPKEHITILIKSKDFHQVKGKMANALRKLVVSRLMKQTANVEEQVRLSLTHQLICPYTALVGKVKVKDPASGEMVVCQ